MMTFRLRAHEECVLERRHCKSRHVGRSLLGSPKPAPKSRHPHSSPPPDDIFAFHRRSPYVTAYRSPSRRKASRSPFAPLSANRCIRTTFLSRSLPHVAVSPAPLPSRSTEVQSHSRITVLARTSERRYWSHDRRQIQHIPLVNT